ncbi:MAG: FkbM family methyltransferase [Solirubrobacterales bacterium]
MKLAFYPAFSDRETFSDHFYRLHWYLLPFSERIDEIVLPHKLQEPTPDDVPSYLDPGLADLVGRLPITLAHVQTDADLANTLDGADYVFVWSSAALGDPALRTVTREGRTIKVDHGAEQYSGSFYLKFAERFEQDQADALARSRDRFERMRDKCEGEIGYIFGTGPGLSTAAEGYDFSDGVAIACNSMVRNHELLDKLQPSLIAIADPIFHAGASSYAGAFRSELVRALDLYDADLVVPLRDIHVYEAHLPDRFTDRIIGIAFETRDEPNLDLTADFSVTSTANVLTLLLLPLAGTLFSRIRIMGCDGRPAHENNYFWSHDKASQINEEMDSIQTAHPSFFSVDYDEYYQSHCDTLEAWLTAAENDGKAIENLSPSHIPALMRRTYPARRGNERPAVSVIMPAFNAAEFIDTAIESVVSQDFEDWELLVVEDDSEDDTANRVYQWASRDRRVSLLRNTAKGVSSARNLGLERARGRYIGFLDADDTFNLGAIGARLAVLDKEGLQMAHSFVRFVSTSGEDLGLELAHRTDLSFADMSGCPAHLNSVLIKTDYARRYRFDVDLPNGEDWLFLARLLRGGVKSRFVPDGGATYRVHADSTVIRDKHTHEQNVLRTLDWIYAPTTGPNVAPQLTAGLSEPPKERTYAQRGFNQLVWAVLSGDEPFVDRFLASSSPSEFLPNLPDSWFENATALAGLRLFGIPRKDLGRIDGQRRREIERIIAKGSLQSACPELVSAVVKVFGLSQNGAKEAAAKGSAIVGPYGREAKATLDETKVFARLLIKGREPERTLIDVGAHHGSSLKAFAKAGWRVLAFEPDRANREVLIERVGSMPNVLIDPRALSDVPAQSVPFFTSDESTGISGLSAFRPTHVDTDAVEVSTVAEVAAAQNVSEVDFLKIDVEGFDWNVLRGVPWDSMKPKAIECEFEDLKTIPMGHTYKDVADYLVERGYTVYLSEWHPIVQYGISHQWRQLAKYPAPLASEDAWGNLLAFIEDPGVDVLREQLSACLKVAAPPAAAPQVGARQAAPPSAAKAPLRNRAHMWARERWLRGENHPVALLGRLGIWMLRRIREHKLATLIYVALLAGLAGVGFISEIEPYGRLAWVLAGGLVLLGMTVLIIGFANFLVAEARTQSKVRHKATNERFVRTERRFNSFEKSQESLGTRTKALASQTNELGSATKALEDRLAAQTNEVGSAIEALEGRLTAQTDEVGSTTEALEDQLGAVEREQRLANATLAASSAAIEASIAELKTDQQAALPGLTAELQARSEELQARTTELQARIEELSAQTSERSARFEEGLAETSKRQDSLETGVSNLAAQTTEVAAASAHIPEVVDWLQARIEELSAQTSERSAQFEERLTETSERDVAPEIVAVLRQLHDLWFPAAEDGVGRPEVDSEHGHDLLMAKLVRRELRSPGVLRGKTLIEIGSTRERYPDQGSTEKLAIFSAVAGMSFITVDMDPLNTSRAERMMRSFNPRAKAVTARGEQFLAEYDGTLEYVYLDAFDFDHGKHSEARQERYRSILNTEIDDRECWQMHQACAAAVVTKMPNDGIVVIDDTWLDDEGNYVGKGKLAVPLLLAAGFRISNSANQSVALVKDEVLPPSAKRASRAAADEDYQRARN